MELLTQKIEQLHKLTRPQIAAFSKLGVFTAKDALLFFPFRYLDFSSTVKIKDIALGENVSLKVTVKSIKKRFSFRSRLNLAEGVFSDQTGSIKAVWFNQGYIADILKPGEEIFLAGKADYYKGLQMQNPLYEKVSDFPIHTSRLVPVYHLTKNLYQKTIRNLVNSCLPFISELEEIIPPQIQQSHKLMNYREAISQLHFPETFEKFLQAQKRQNFEEIFLNQLLAQKQKMLNRQKGALKIPFDQGLVKKFVASLPFALTPEQKKAAWEILQDMEKPEPMNRLLEGDVGSGKTLVAFIAALQAMQRGFQVALLCPTEVLAKQHHESALKHLADKKLFLNCRSILYTQNYSLINRKEKTKQELLQELKDGMPGLYIGTHALLEKSVRFKKLALAIVDEQHRFGVRQRGALLSGLKPVPHLLSMSATPIPRTLKLALTGELEISQIAQKPAERKPILTKLVTEENRQKAYEFIYKEIQKGRQAFVITPLIEESESTETKSAKAEAENLQKVFSTFSIGLLYGKMKGKEKEEVMKDFLQNKIQILVSTSVVEVGVDVPNASVMLIEGAERFGLAQLHQFRGRVGRAEHQSYCFLFTSENIPRSSPLTLNSPSLLKRGLGGVENETLQRLHSFTKTQNGFQLAEFDLKQRGFGKLFGQEQSGWDYKYFNPDYLSLIPKAREEAKQLLEKDITLSDHPLLSEKLKGQQVHFE